MAEHENVCTETLQNTQAERSKQSAKRRKPPAFLKNWSLYLLLLPTTVYLLIFCYVPILGSVIAFKDYNAFLGIWDSPWAASGGFQHFVNFVTMPNFWNILGNTLVLSIASIIFNTILPVVFALFVNELRWNWAKKTVQVISYAPYFISTVVVVGMLFSFSSIESGVFNKIITLCGGDPTNIMESKGAFAAIYVISGLWQGLGWWSIVYFGALSNVDKELHEAAVLDGAGRFRRIWHINLPTILPMVIIMFIMSIGNMLNVGFEKVYLMQTNGNLSASEIISTYVYRVSMLATVPQYSYATAIGLFNSFINIILLVIANVISKRVSQTSLW
ncbi:MAG: sugar ABC transporter permease [Clostridia bacterium]|jgi:putative aldouronate transport system permease protein|nr:sugar ABC transporter permease [Clostridia bacterium]